MSNTRVFQIDGVHQVVQRDMRVAAAQTGKQGREKAQKGVHWVSAERAEEKVKPHYIGFQLIQGLQQPNRAGRIVERPAA